MAGALPVHVAFDMSESKFFGRLAAIGDVAGEPERVRTKRHTLVYAGLLMSLGGLIWGTICAVFGLWVQAVIPYAYVGITLINFLLYWRTKSFAVAAKVQLLNSLLLPFALQWVLGGFMHSGAMMLWALLCLAGAVALEEGKAAWGWLAAFAVLGVVSGVLEPQLEPPEVIRSSALRTILFVLNTIVISSLVFLLLWLFGRDRERAIGELEIKNRQLAQSQQALITSEKLAALGQLVAGVAHELNTPLGAIRASVGNMASALDETVRELPRLAAHAPPQEFESFLTLLRDAQAAKPLATSKEERQARRRLTRELESMGLDGATSLADTLTDVGLRSFDAAYEPALRGERREAFARQTYGLSSLERNSRNIRVAADRAAKIVFALKSYAHPGADDAFTEASLSDNLETVLTLYHNQIKRGVEVLRSFDDEVMVEGMHDRLNQVWTNLVHNALQAMDYSGTLEVAVKGEGAGVRVEVIDDGKGIPAGALERIFEPFYTTKEAGEGTGLGLSICKDIIDRHHGSIEVVSRPGRTCFSVWLPREAADPGEIHHV